MSTEQSPSNTHSISPKRKRSPSPQPPVRIHAGTPQLLLTLPALLALPPTHPHHTMSLRLSLLAVRRCLQLRDCVAAGMTPELECRAWTAFVELGMKIVGAGLSGEGPSGEDWAKGLENEIGSAIGKGIVIAQKHPSLHLYTHHLTLQHAQLAQWQQHHKFARALLRRHCASLSSANPNSHHYATHLMLVSLALSANPVDISSALHSLVAIQSLADRWGHTEVGLLAQVIKLRALVSALRWTEVFPLLNSLEPKLELTFPDNPKPSKPSSQIVLKSTTNVQSTSEPSTPTPSRVKSQNTTLSTPQIANAVPSSSTKSELWATLELHVLALGVLAHVQAGRSSDASKRIARLHTILDSGVLERTGIREGVVEVPLGASDSSHAPLFIHTTHPRVFFHLAFLLSAVAMRDATGRRPKPKVFATEGLAACERERPKPDQKAVGRYLRWSGLGVRQDVEERLSRIEADLLCELIGVCIQRSEFDDAEENLARLIAHVRTHQLWDAYSARVTLYHAHLAHALQKTDRALEYYRVAAHLAAREERSGRTMLVDGEKNSKVHTGVAVARFLRVAAQAGEVGLRIGMARECMGSPQVIDDSFKKWGSDVAKECRALGGTLEAVGRVIEACLTDEIVLAKNHLKASLNLTTQALDNHLRALVLALASSHYLHTSSEYAEVMLSTARQLAAGLGAPASKSQDPQPLLGPDASAANVASASSATSAKGVRRVGNAALGLWVGQRFQEIYRRTGRDKRARRQADHNAELTCALEEIQLRGGRSAHHTPEAEEDMQVSP